MEDGRRSLVSGKMLYRATPKPAPEPHSCDELAMYDSNAPVGSIWECECGRYWFRKLKMRYDEGLSWESHPWYKVRWYHFGLRHLIRRETLAKRPGDWRIV